MQGEIKGAPGVGDSKLALIGGVSNRQVKPEERREEKRVYCSPQKKSISKPRSGCPVAI